MDTTIKPKLRKGFAVMSPELRSQIGRLGGQAAHRYGKAHEFTTEEAIAAGKKGGRKVSEDREHMRRIGQNKGRAVTERRHEQRLAEDIDAEHE